MPTGDFPSGYTCGCGQWVSNYATVAHTCPSRQPMYWPQGVPPTPLFPDPRLFALQEQIAKALERIADALEGLKKPTMCGESYDAPGGMGLWICTRDAGHDQATGHTSSPLDLLRFK
jgi:hypothetical protein